MAKFYDVVGFAVNTEMAPGVWQDIITEKSYFGDIVKDMTSFQQSEKVNVDITLRNSVSIVADDYASEHIFAIRYVRWAGSLWKVVDIDATRRPRLILRLGGVYNGPTA